MEKLDRLIVAEPATDTASAVAEKLDRLAETVDVTHRGQDTIAKVKELRPEMLVLSLEITDGDANEVLTAIRKSGVETFVFATYRELSVQGMKKLGRHGIGEFAPHPLDVTSVYRAASNHFGRHFRRHTRHQVKCPVVRIDGTQMGTTLDLSEGGMQVRLDRDIAAGMSQLWEVALDDGQDKPLRVRCAVLGVDSSEGKQTAARVQFEKIVGPELSRLSKYLQSLES
ncbi:MAG: PilZ domain-containing protein [Myxococcota bacterium]